MPRAFAAGAGVSGEGQLCDVHSPRADHVAVLAGVAQLLAGAVCGDGGRGVGAGVHGGRGAGESTAATAVIACGARYQNIMLSSSSQVFEPGAPDSSKMTARASLPVQAGAFSARRFRVEKGIFTVCHSPFGVNDAAH